MVLQEKNWPVEPTGQNVADSIGALVALSSHTMVVMPCCRTDVFRPLNRIQDGMVSGS